MSAAVRGYDMTIVLPEKMSTEKTDVLQALGAKIVRTPTEAAFDRIDSHLNTAFKMKAENENAEILDQYINDYNPVAHYDGTGAEIVYQTDKKVTHVFVGTGTGGTITGIAHKVKQEVPTCKIVGVDPYGSILARPMKDNDPNVSYKVEGTGYDFIPPTCD